MRPTSRPPADGRRRALRRRAGEGDPAADQRDRARRVPLHLLEVVGREDDGAAARGDAVDDLPDAPPLARVERGGGLVEEEHVGPPEQRDRDVEPLQAADREPARRPVRLLEPDRPEQVPRLHLRLRETLEAGEEPRGSPARRGAGRARAAAAPSPPSARCRRSRPAPRSRAATPRGCRAASTSPRRSARRARAPRRSRPRRRSARARCAGRSAARPRAPRAGAGGRRRRPRRSAADPPRDDLDLLVVARDVDDPRDVRRLAARERPGELTRRRRRSDFPVQTSVRTGRELRGLPSSGEIALAGTVPRRW